jgi:ketosteroid isomerase-like protein
VSAGDNLGQVRAGYAAFNRRDAEAVLAFLAPDAEYRFRSPGADEELVAGREDLLRFYAALFEAFEQIKIEVRDAMSDGDTVRVRGSIVARVRATGESTVASFRHTFTFRDGLGVKAVYEDPINPFEFIRARSLSSRLGPP